MTDIQAVKALLDENWKETLSGRATDVPEPQFVLQQDVSRGDLKGDDIARIVDGGGRSFEPRGFSWTHERIEADVTVELRTSDRRVQGTKVDGRERLFGPRAGTAEPDRYVGLAGEAKRIFDAHRKGFAEYDRVIASATQDTSANEGTNYYRADIDVALIQDAHQINPSP